MNDEERAAYNREYKARRKARRDAIESGQTPITVLPIRSRKPAPAPPKIEGGPVERAVLAELGSIAGAADALPGLYALAVALGRAIDNAPASSTSPIASQLRGTMREIRELTKGASTAGRMAVLRGTLKKTGST